MATKKIVALRYGTDRLFVTPRNVEWGRKAFGRFEILARARRFDIRRVRRLVKAFRERWPDAHAPGQG